MDTWPLNRVDRESHTPTVDGAGSPAAAFFRRPHSHSASISLALSLRNALSMISSVGPSWPPGAFTLIRSTTLRRISRSAGVQIAGRFGFNADEDVRGSRKRSAQACPVQSSPSAPARSRRVSPRLPRGRLAVAQICADGMTAAFQQCCPTGPDGGSRFNRQRRHSG